MGDGLLPLFPPYGVDQTIHIAILFGVVILLALTEWFGWVFSGLVVPGYLASLFVLEPASGATVVIEALLTFGLARLVSNVASKTGAWNLFFGRERFLLLVFISIAVRQASEQWLLPDAARLLDDQLGTTFRLTRTFSSVGLVLVPLTANMFWKLDLRRGLFQVAVPTAITYAILAYVLLPYTNLSFSALEITYENVALDFLSSPKAYILLITGAYLASRWNLLYGWDYAGILVPALLGLAWLSPFRLVTTLVETLMLVIFMRMLMRAPGFRTMNLEGPRKVALVFAVSFLLKWSIGWFVGPTLFGLQVSDLFGFGYLLSSLVAVKILQKDAIARITVPTLLVSVATVVIGSLIGFGLDKVAPAPVPVAELPAVAATPTTTVLAQTPAGVLALGHVRARLDVAGDVPLERSAYERGRYGELWSAIDDWLDAGAAAAGSGTALGAAPGVEQARREVERRAGEMGLALRRLDKLGKLDAWGLFELEERLVAHVGWDTAVLVPGAPGPVIVVPRPASESPTAEVAAKLCERTSCRAVIVSGLDLTRSRAAGEGRAPHEIARGAFGSAPVLELRTDTSLAKGRSVLHVAKEVADPYVAKIWIEPEPAGAKPIATVELLFKPAPGGDHLEGASVLRAHPDDYWKVVIGVSSIALNPGVAIEAWFAKMFERLDPRTRQQTPRAAGAVVPEPAGRGSGAAPIELASDITNQPPSQSELRFLQLLVAGPALDDRRERANAMAALVGYGVQELPDGLGDKTRCWILAETARPRRLGWGVLAGRADKAAPVAVEIPRPRLENGAWRIGVELWRHTSAATLIVADGDVPPERVDADPAGTWNVMTGFQAFHQAVHDAQGATGDAVILQIRGFGVTQPIRDALVVTLPRPVLVTEQLPARLAAIVAPKGPLGFAQPARIYDGARDYVDVAGTGNPQLNYCSRFETTTCAMLWFSETVRDAYREVDRDREMAKLERMKVPPIPTSAAAALLEPALTAPDPARVAAAQPRFAELTRIAEAYAIEQNVQLLRVLVDRANASGGAIGVRGGFSDELGRPFLVVELHEGDLVIRALVLVPSGSERVDVTAGDGAAARVRAQIERRPRIVTLAGRSSTVVPPAPAKQPAKRPPRRRGAR